MRTVLRILIAAGALVLTGLAQAQDSFVLAIKATYLYKFAPFVEWPAAAFESPIAPLELCVVGGDPFGAILDQAVARQKMGEHPIVVRRIALPARGCKIAFVSGEESFIAESMVQFRGMPVLTVTDVRAEAPVHGIVNFVVEANHVRFDVDDAAAAQNGLSISSKLLRLARAVRPR